LGRLERIGTEWSRLEPDWRGLDGALEHDWS